MRFHPAYLILLPILFSGVGTANAETLNMPAGETAPQATMQMEMPSKGMSKDQVARNFGQPRQKLGPVGEPPISRWVYDGYTVYFEHQFVIHSVINQ